ncbi:MAG: trypsin-like peptidase domain-containing protein [Anaerolineales bacterium]
MKMKNDKKTKRTSSKNVRLKVWLLLIFSLLLLTACDSGVAPTEPIEATVEVLETFNEEEAFLADEQNTVDIVNAFGHSVVAINVTVQGEVMRPFANIPPDQLPPEFRDLLPFLDEEVPMRQSAGSGFVIDSRASGMSYLVTNYHVVQGGLQPGTTKLLDGASITAVFPQHSDVSVPVKVVGANPSFDLALLAKLSPSDSFPEVTGLKIANSDAVQVGQKVIAIGNPFGLEFTVTTGIVSAIGRFVPSIGQITIPTIQTDAAINPGNSGGPLLNSQGELIGINTLIINPEGRSSAGVGFAVPSNLLMEALSNLELGGLSDIGDTRPTLGADLRTVSLLPEGIRELIELPDEGVVIVDVLPGSPADKAGLRGSQRRVDLGSIILPAGGDVITAVNGVQLMDAEQLNQLITYEGEPGDQLEFTLLRDGQEIEVTVTLEILD